MALDMTLLDLVKRGLRARRVRDVMRTAPPPRRLFVSGRQLEYWEHPDVPFGWSPEDLEGYAKRGHWVLLFSAILLTVPRHEMDHAS